MNLPFAVINDCHIGVIRSAGTTPITASALRQYALQQFEQLLMYSEGHDLLVNGDLFDTDHIPYSDLLATYTLLAQWLIANPDSKLYLPPGNHDLSKTTATMSSQQFLAKLLRALLPNRVLAPGVGQEIAVAGARGWVIPHMPNQEQFDIELSKVPKKGIKYLFLHCNFDNHFAVQSDHSLNLSKEQAAALPVKCILLGHEHQRTMGLSGKVLVPGNQFPTSVADCLGNTQKFMTVITEEKLELRTVWTAGGVNGTSYQKLDWRDLGKAEPTSQFIRVEGDASDTEASAVVTAISKLRKSHNAFVISNAVKIEGRDDVLAVESMEKVANFNVVAALFALLDKKNPAWSAKVKKIMETNDVSAT